MKTNKTKKIANKSLTIKIISLLLLAVFCVAMLFVGFNYFNNKKPLDVKPNTTPLVNSIDYKPPTTEQKQAGEDQKKLNDSTNITNISASITSINSSADPIQIRTIINGSVSNSGTCELRLLKSGINIIKTTDTYALPNSSTCKGFDISRSDLSAGNWTVNLTVTIDDQITTASSGFILD